MGVYVGVAIVPHVSEKLWGYANPSLIKAWNALVSTAALTEVFGVPKAPGNLITERVLLQQDLVLGTRLLAVAHEVGSESLNRATTSVPFRPSH